MSKTSLPKVTPKSTKNDILEAYENLLTQLEDQPLSTPAVSQLKTKNLDLKKALQTTVEQIQTTLTASIEELSDQFMQAQQVLDQIATQQTTQHHFLQAQKTKFEEDQTQHEEELVKERNRTQEEYDYEFEKKKKRQEIELKELRVTTEKDLNQRISNLKAQEDELESLRKQVSEFETKLQSAVKSAVETTTQQLQSVFNHEKTLADQKSEHNDKLANQQIAALKQTVEGQQKEIVRLQKEVSSSNEQLTRIAEKAVSHSVMGANNSSGSSEK